MDVACEHVIRGDQLCGKRARYIILIYDMRPPDVALGMIERWYTGIRARCEEHVRDLFQHAADSEAVIEAAGPERHHRHAPMVKLPEDAAAEVRERQRRRRERQRAEGTAPVRRRNVDGTPRYKDPQ